jgi:hypothetical protein
MGLFGNAGSIIGAALGTAVAPGIGTALGYGIGDSLSGGSGLGGFWGDITGANASKRAAKEQRRAAALAAQVQRETLAQQMEMFNRQQEMISPFVDMSEGAMGQMGVLTGTQGADAQQQAISSLENSPLFQSQVQQGENALLQNAAATGGLRGGNTQGALAQFRPGMLQNEINQQFNRLGGIAQLGMGPLSQASAGFGQMANAQGQFGTNMSNLYNQMGQQQASNELAQYQMNRDMFFDVAGLGLKAGGLFI